MVELVGEEFRLSIVQRLRAAHVSLAARWLDRLSQLLPVPPTDVFPSDTLLDHIPELILDIADYLAAPGESDIAANTRALAKAQELGDLRYAQRASIHLIMREYRLLESVLLTFVREQAAQTVAPTAVDVGLGVAAHLHVAVSVLQEATVNSFIARHTATIAEQTRRLESFNRMATHELRQPLGALQFAIKLLHAQSLGSQEHHRLLTVLDRNIARVVTLTGTLARVSGLHVRPDTVQRQRVSLATVARQVARQLREMAHERGVTIGVDEALPEAEVDVAALELALVNLVSNAVKYRDSAKAVRRVDIRPGIAHTPTAGAYIIEVADNGIGIPANCLPTICEPGNRAHVHRDRELSVDGLGLGLAIARDCARALGGDIAVESTEGAGTTVTLWFRSPDRGVPPPETA